MRNPSSSTTSTAKAKAGGGSTTTSKTPCCSKIGMKRGPWTPEEDELLSKYIKREGEGRWRTLPKRAGLLRCGKSCRLRWMNYLRPSVKRGHIAPDEEDLILRLHRLLGNRWSLIAGRIPGRTDNEIKNYWNTHLSKKLISQGIDPRTHKPLDPNSDDKQAASKKAVPNPNSALEETVLVTGRLNIVSNNKGNNELYQYQCEGGLNLQSSDDGMGLSSGHGNNNINEDNNNNYCTDDVFSSFLNSLINEDVFNSQQVVLHQPPPEDDPLISSNSLQSITFAPHGWDAPALLHQNNDPKMFNGHVENHF